MAVWGLRSLGFEALGSVGYSTVSVSQQDFFKAQSMRTMATIYGLQAFQLNLPVDLELGLNGGWGRRFGGSPKMLMSRYLCKTIRESERRSKLPHSYGRWVDGIRFGVLGLSLQFRALGCRF